MKATRTSNRISGRQRGIGPLGTIARVVVGGLLLASVTTFLYFEQARLVEARFPDSEEQTRVFGIIDRDVQLKEAPDAQDHSEAPPPLFCKCACFDKSSRRGTVSWSRAGRSRQTQRSSPVSRSRRRILSS